MSNEFHSGLERLLASGVRTFLYRSGVRRLLGCVRSALQPARSVQLEFVYPGAGRRATGAVRSAQSPARQQPMAPASVQTGKIPIPRDIADIDVASASHVNDTTARLAARRSLRDVPNSQTSSRMRVDAVDQTSLQTRFQKPALPGADEPVRMGAPTSAVRARRSKSDAATFLNAQVVSDAPDLSDATDEFHATRRTAGRKKPPTTDAQKMQPHRAPIPGNLHATHPARSSHDTHDTRSERNSRAESAADTPPHESDWHLPFSPQALRSPRLLAGATTTSEVAPNALPIASEVAPQNENFSQRPAQTLRQNQSPAELSHATLEKAALKEALDSAEEIAISIERGVDWIASAAHPRPALVTPDLAAWLRAGGPEISNPEAAPVSEAVSTAPADASTMQPTTEIGAKKQRQKTAQKNTSRQPAAEPAAPDSNRTPERAPASGRFVSRSADYFERRFAAHSRLRPRR